MSPQTIILLINISISCRLK